MFSIYVRSNKRIAGICLIVLLAVLAALILSIAFSKGMASARGEVLSTSKSTKLANLMAELVNPAGRKKAEEAIWDFYRENNDLLPGPSEDSYPVEHYTERAFPILPSIMERLGTDDDGVKVALLHLLAKCGETGNSEHTVDLQKIALSKNSASVVREAVVVVLGRWQTARSLQTMETLSADPDCGVRCSVALALSRWENGSCAKVASILKSMANNGEGGISRISAAYFVISKHHDFNAIDVLINASASDVPINAAMSITYLQQLFGLCLGGNLVSQRVPAQISTEELRWTLLAVDEAERSEFSKRYAALLWAKPDNPLHKKLIAMWQEWWQVNHEFVYFLTIQETRLQVNETAKAANKPVDHMSGQAPPSARQKT